MRVLRFFALLFLCVMSAMPAYAVPPDMDDFAQIPVMHEGRIKPMDSFARALLKQFSGRDDGAIFWLAETLFNPAEAEHIPVLKVTHPDILNFLDIQRRESKLYSYVEISSALGSQQDSILSILDIPEDTWTPAQSGLIMLQTHTVLLGDLLSSLSLFLPLSVRLPDDVPIDLHPYAGRVLTYMDAVKIREILQTELNSILKAKGEDLKHYTDAEQAMVYLSFAIDNLQQAGQRSHVFRVIPSRIDDAWQAPWEIILNGDGRPGIADSFKGWEALSRAYHDNDFAGWSQAASRLRYADSSRPEILQAEYFYNRIDPLMISALLYGVALLVLTGGAIWEKNDWAGRIAGGLLGAGIIAHSLAVVARIYILQRPPVSTLYESIIFVGLVAAFYGGLSYYRHRALFWLYLGAGAGFILHLVGFSNDQGGDSFLMLSAVLNTNFWLATHVICITAGYAYCLVTSALAHYSLFRGEREQGQQSILFKSMHHTALLALLFSAVGTVLGGIWADQSWGRFWGWDPKENGALLIVLWLIWVLHGRISGQMNTIAVAAGLAYLSVIVALSWFGVNLLSVGLHAYGFTDSASWGLGIFVALETVLIGGLVIKQHRRRNCHAG